MMRARRCRYKKNLFGEYLVNAARLPAPVPSAAAALDLQFSGQETI